MINAPAQLQPDFQTAIVLVHLHLKRQSQRDSESTSYIKEGNTDVGSGASVRRL